MFRIACTQIRYATLPIQYFKLIGDVKTSPMVLQGQTQYCGTNRAAKIAFLGRHLELLTEVSRLCFESSKTKKLAHNLNKRPDD